MSASNQTPRHMPKKGTDPVVRLLFWLLVIVCVAGFLEFKGPYKGWLTSRLNQQKPADTPVDIAQNEVPAEPPAPDVDPEDPADPGDVDLTGEAPAEEPPKSEMELLYDKLYAQYLAKYTPPTEGAAIKLRLREGDDIIGKIEEVSPGKVKLRLKFGTMTYPLHVIHPSMYPYLFPERAAKMKALADIEEMQERERREAEAQVTAAVDRNREATEAAVREQQAAADREAARKRRQRQEQERQAAIAAQPKDGPFQYDPSPSSTPEHLLKTVQAFGMRLNYQQRAMGAPIAKKIYAKQQQDKVVLYMIMSKTYQAQAYDTRYAIADQLWSIWSMRCNEGGKVRGPSGAHIVLLDETGKQIGGSTERNATDIWVKQGKG